LRKELKVDFEEIKVLLAQFIEKHPSVVALGAEYIWQSDKAQEDALQLVCDIFDNWE